MDFVKIATKSPKRGVQTIYPEFRPRKSKDLMIRGGDFYAVWDEENGVWSTDEDRVSDMIDAEIKNYDIKTDDKVIRLYMNNADSGSIDRWHKLVQRQMRDNYHPLDKTMVFADSPINKNDYASKRLPYSLSDSEPAAWNELVSSLYEPEEQHKIEWAIGAVVNGDSKDLQKFVVFHGPGGTGKSTILNIIQMLFDGYCESFHAKSLGGNDPFALEPFKNNPLVAIDHEGDLSRIEDNTRLNNIVSHEPMTVNEKYTKLYTNTFHSMLFIGTNKPVKITDSKSGVIRRLIDVYPKGTLIPRRRYNQLMSQIKFELGSIAQKCKNVYEEAPDYYDDYVPVKMISATNDMFNFVESQYYEFLESDSTSLGYAWSKYKNYCIEANIPYPLKQRVFKEELKAYFKCFDIRKNGEYNIYSGFKREKFEMGEPINSITVKTNSWLILKEQPSLFDEVFADCPAQYGSSKETPIKSWKDVTTTLKDINTHELHYVLFPEKMKSYICFDFDLKDSNGEKSFELNYDAASNFPPTYAELSKSGQAIHLIYFYDGDVNELSRIYGKDIEIKVFNGNSSLRRKLTTCNDLPISSISSGLPKKEKKVISQDVLQDERHIRNLINKCLRKENHGATAPEVDFIKKILDDAYASGIEYDVSDMKQKVGAFALKSTHQSQKCLKTVSKMHFQSAGNEEPKTRPGEYKSDKLVFFDVEVFMNFFGICWKFHGDPHVTKMFNPTPAEVSELLDYKLVGFNNRRYDNHIIYGRLQGFTNQELFNLSQRIVDKGDKNAFFREAYNLSYTDIYDFSSKKQSLKKWEIELGIHHQELGLKWDEPVPEELWETVMDYCANDVIATEAVFDHLSADFEAREILCAITGSSLNSTTNQNTTKLIVGNVTNPQSEFVYTDLSKMFPGYKFEAGVSTYKGEEVGEGGYVYAEPGMHTGVALLDVASMHPHSALNLNIFGPYTKNFEELVKARLFIKHGDYDAAGKLFDGKLKPYLQDKEQAASLAYALKIAINSVYGLTAAKFDNKLRDPRNVDNIVAKRGALFMIDLKGAVQERGYTVAHIKTDSIKIPNADPEIIDFVMEFGKKYGYTFEHEATYDRMCLVNDAVYIAKYASKEWCEKAYGYIPEKNFKKSGKWDATGTQFQVPYVFKTLFSREPIEFRDKCETKTVTSALYLDMNEGLGDDEHDYQFVGKAGLFCPIKSGCGGGLLMREKDGKYNAATGTKGYRWLEAETVQNLNKEDDIDLSYYNRLVDDAIKSISEYGDAEWFINSEQDERSN